THAGPEIAVASTKAHVTQVACLTLLALALGQERGSGPQAEIAAACARVPELAAQVEARLEGEIRDIVETWHSQRDAFFIGRGLDFAVALEGQLKLKEISYVHAEALVAGELKHGTLALIAPGVPVVALATQPHLAAKMHNNAEEVAARGGDVLWITTPSAAAVSGLSNGRPRQGGGRRIFLPDVAAEIAPVLAVIPLQLLAYHWAKRCGRDVDKPRNLAKSVTVE
ncbi:MAG TPA: SIS domain-containing protein, partial [Limnochordia bacterium]